MADVTDEMVRAARNELAEVTFGGVAPHSTFVRAAIAAALAVAPPDPEVARLREERDDERREVASLRLRLSHATVDAARAFEEVGRARNLRLAEQWPTLSAALDALRDAMTEENDR